ncbi:MAG TPA: sigma 54-interacting transcriptional regulator, partial [Polyangiaceae bacterium]|nr:sigma 54-interacting transcriptional regulator [Polyangiaceae bacterium]
SPRPVSISRCGAFGFADLGTLLKLLSQAVELGWVQEAVRPAGHFQWQDHRHTENLFSQASPEDWKAVFEALDLSSWGLGVAREAAQSGAWPRARVFYWALVVGLRAHPDLFDKARWLEVVMEALRLFRREVNWLSDEIQALALEQAVQLGDERAESVLLAIRAYEMLRCGRAGEAMAWCDRALEVSARLDDPETRQHVLLYVANNWMLMGRLREALSMLESFLGDIPPDLLAPSQTIARDTLMEASIATLANLYAWTGKDERAQDLLLRMVEVGKQTRQPLLVKMGSIYLAWYHADRDDLEQARHWSREALAALEPDDAVTAYCWFASQPAAWVAYRDSDFPLVKDLLERGHHSRVSSGHTHFQNSYLLEVLAELRRQGGSIEGLEFEEELARLTVSPDQRMKGVGLRFRAAQKMESGQGDASEDLRDSMELLESAGAVPELLRTLRMAASFAARQGNQKEAAALQERLRDVGQFGTTKASAGGSDARESHVARAIVDLGRLTQLSHRREGFFGEIVARICRELAVERCALLDSTEEVRVLAARGGDRAWLDSLALRVKGPGGEVVRSVEAGEGGGQLLLIPYRIDELGRKGWICLENHVRPPLLGPGDGPWLESLGVQMSVLIGNVALWEELVAVRQRLERENRYYREGNPAPVASGRMVGDSPAFRHLIELIGKVAPTRSAALILGETGVGKELVAQEIHRLSAHRNGPFIAVHVASLPPGLVASALFGHERGAFTGATEQVRGRFELANGGTIFLDEIGELGVEDQVRLLRVLQEGTFERVGGTKTLRSSFRLVAATNRDLAALVREAKFREVLYYRLNVFPVVVPPLRDRLEDIPKLAFHFLDQYARRAGKEYEGIGEADMDRLLEYAWPGNVRELEHVIERAVVLSDPPMLKIPTLATSREPSSSRTPKEFRRLEEVERQYIREVLNHVGGKITGKAGAAEILGMKPSTLQFRIDKLGLREALDQSRYQGKAARRKS